MSTHTPTTVDEEIAAYAFIVRAVNSFDDLVEALKTVATQYALFVGPDDDIANATKEVVRAALEKAGAL